VAFTGLLAVAVGFALVPASELPADLHELDSVLDIHVHAAGVGAGNSGCFIGQSVRDSYKFPLYLGAFGVELEELERAGDVLVLRRISERIRASRHVSRAVVLALDGVIGPAGRLDRARTQVYVPNEFLARELPAFDNLLFGASVNPHRTDALARLERVKAQGAVLVKWIPAIMDIDPADSRLDPFYRKLVALDLPLLTHTGQERSFGEARDELGDPRRLERPLALGVRVIAAHVATTGSTDGQEHFERLLPLFARYRNLHADISSLTQINKLGYLARALEQPDLRGRLVYGSDWPLQFFPLVWPWYQLGRVSPGRIKAVTALENAWDRDVALKRAMGVPVSAFRSAAQLLGFP
jgi:hypothetical protein